MVNYAPDYSTRVKVRELGPAGDHDLLIRMGTLTNPSTILTYTQDFMNQLGVLISNSASLDSAQYALEGSNAFTPLAVTPVSGSNGVTYTAGSQAAGYFTAPIFKSGAGSRYILYVYYANPLFNQACRFAYDDLPGAWTDLRDLLEGGHYTAIDRGTLIAYGHVDVGINDEVTAKQRRLP